MKPQMTFASTIPLPTATRGVVDLATLELFAAWRKEDSTDDPDAVRAAERDLAEFKKALNENRASSGEHFPF